MLLESADVEGGFLVEDLDAAVRSASGQVLGAIER